LSEATNDWQDLEVKVSFLPSMACQHFFNAK
jgi:hypothetical protein